MCLPIVARILAVEDGAAEVELLPDAGRARVECTLFPDATAGQYVLVDRGLIMELIEAEQAKTVLAFYSELAEFWDGIEDSLEEESLIKGAEGEEVEVHNG